jgi:hypothetical protein
VAISKFIATAYISPTPNEEQMRATLLAVSPTPSPAPPTPFPSPTPYIGVFIGEAVLEGGLPPLTGPLLADTPIFSAQPTADARRCVAVPFDRNYESIWVTNSRMAQRIGCPIQAGFGFFGHVQVFERGVIYRREDTREVWAILPQPGGPGQYWYVEKPAEVSTAGISAPEGRIVPDGDIGSVWVSIEGLQEEMGLALTPRQRVAMGAQRYDTGTMLLDATSGQVFALIVDGTAFGPFPAPSPSSEPAPTELPTTEGG